MDPLTHGLAGALIAKMGPERRLGSPALPLLVTAALLPDVDHLAWWWGNIAFIQYHRGLTHSVPGALVLSFLLAGVVRPFIRAPAFMALMWASLLGILSHIGLDVITAYGTQVWYPFTRTRYALDLAFIIDPILTATLLLPLLLGWVVRPRATTLARTGGLLLLAYLLLATVNHDRAIGTMQRVLSVRGLEAQSIAALPQPFSPFGWTTIAQAPGRYYIARFHFLDPTQPEVVAYPKASDDPVVVQARQDRAVQVYEWFARFPIILHTVRGNRHILEYADLRFPTGSIRLTRMLFRLRVVLDPSGHVLESSLR